MSTTEIRMFRAYATGGFACSMETPQQAAIKFFETFPTKRKCDVIEGWVGRRFPGNYPIIIYPIIIIPSSSRIITPSRMTCASSPVVSPPRSSARHGSCRLPLNLLYKVLYATRYH